MTTARRIIVGVLLPLAIIGALVLSASATIDFAVASGVSPALAPAAVAMLELLSLAGTGLWIFVTGNVSLRREAIGATLFACSVSMVAGVFAYGPLGLIGPLGLVGVAHLASRIWRTADEEPQLDVDAISEDFGVPISPPVATTTYVYRLVNGDGVLLYVGITVNVRLRLDVHRRQKDWWSEVAEVSTEQYPDRASALAVEQSAIVNEQPLYNQRPGMLRDAHGGGQPATVVERAHFPVTEIPELRDVSGLGTDTVAAAATLLAADPSIGRPRLIAELGVTDHQARKLLRALRPVQAVAS